MFDPSWPVLPVTHRGFVFAWEVDCADPQTERLYASRYDEATWQLLALLGAGPAWLLAQRCAFAQSAQTLANVRPVRAGSVLHVESELVELDRRTMRCRHTLRDSECESALSTAERTISLVRLDGTPVDWPRGVLRRARLLFPRLAMRCAER